ncbi:MAG: hypothetical protein ACKOSO_10025, partial [Actinomycetota bacterium]
MDLLALVADQRCVACAAPGRLGCAACRRALPWLGPPGCLRCGGAAAVAPCPTCAGLDPALAWVRTAVALHGEAPAPPEPPREVRGAVDAAPRGPLEGRGHGHEDAAGHRRRDGGDDAAGGEPPDRGARLVLPGPDGVARGAVQGDGRAHPRERRVEARRPEPRQRAPAGG